MGSPDPPAAAGAQGDRQSSALSQEPKHENDCLQNDGAAAECTVHSNNIRAQCPGTDQSQVQQDHLDLQVPACSPMQVGWGEPCLHQVGAGWVWNSLLYLN